MGTLSSFQPSYTQSRLRSVTAREAIDDDETNPWDEGAPLLSNSGRMGASQTLLGYGTGDRVGSRSRRGSGSSSRRRLQSVSTEAYNVNYPPSVPGSPTLGPADRRDLNFGDDLLRDEMDLNDASSPRRSLSKDRESLDLRPNLEPPPQLIRRSTISMPHEDVCFPTAGMSELADDELHTAEGIPFRPRHSRRRRKWPDLSVLEEWSQLEKEGKTEERRVKKITEPQLVNGRLRPVHKGWYVSEEDAPYRFTYFNEDFPSTIHTQTISELVQPGGSFEELFIPEPRLLSDDSDSESEDELESNIIGLHHARSGPSGESTIPTRQPSSTLVPLAPETKREGTMSPTQVATSTAPSEAGTQTAGTQTPTGIRSPTDVKQSQDSSDHKTKAKALPRFGDRPVWWLDVFNPTESEMRALTKAFEIHPLTGEDIIMQEAREKVELFRHYYFVNYRTFDQDRYSESHLRPVDMYVVVFREGVLSFHFSMTPHAANVRRRIRQLKDYIPISPDWISYAIIDDITDVFSPLIQSIEDEVDEIDDAILRLHSSSDERIKEGNFNEKAGEDGESGGDMLRRVGDCRKKVIGLYRLLGNKADVIKGFAKRCNEQWDVAPRSDIGMYLGDIQDHIVTMTSNLGHYEKCVSFSSLLHPIFTSPFASTLFHRGQTLTRHA
jgi:magnesium transporter